MTSDWRDEIIKLGSLSAEEKTNVEYEPLTATFHDINGIPTEMTIIVPVIKKEPV